MVNALLFWLNTGIPWRDLPERFGPWKSVYTRFRRWTAQGVWDALLTGLIQEDVVDNTELMLDSTVIKVHQHGSGKKGGANKGRGIGGLTTKVHAIADGLGNPLRFMLSAGTRNDIMCAQPMLEPFELEGKHVLADMGYDQEKLCEYIRSRGGTPVIPSRITNRIQRTIDKHEYKERHLVENLFQKLKNFRRLATRYEKLDITYFAVVSLAASRLWLV
jgi:transposase